MRAALRLKSSTVPRRLFFPRLGPVRLEKDLTAALFHLTYTGSFLYTPASLFVYLNVFEVRGAAKGGHIPEHWVTDNAVPKGSVVFPGERFPRSQRSHGPLFARGFIVHFLVHMVEDRAEGSLRTATVKNPRTTN